MRNLFYNKIRQIHNKYRNKYENKYLIYSKSYKSMKAMKNI